MKTKRIFGKIYQVLQNSFKVSSIQSVIILSFTAVAILSMFLLSIALYSMFSENAERNAAASTQQILEQVNLNLENYMNGMKEISDIINTNLEGNAYTNKDYLKNLLSTTSVIRKDIVTMAVYTGKGELFLSNPSGGYDTTFTVTGQDWYKNALARPTEYVFQPPHVQRMFEGKRPWVVSLCRGVTVNGVGGSETWVSTVDMNFSAIEQLCKKVSLGKRGYIYIIDSFGNIIYHPQQQMIYVNLKEENIKSALNPPADSFIDNFQGERRIMTIKNMSYTGWKIVGISYLDELTENRTYFNNSIMVIVLFGFIFEVVASLFISSKITQPIKKLEKQMKKVENGDFNISLEVKGEDEVKRLSKSFNLMISRIRQLMEQIINEQQEIRKSELKALQAQISPHFLYNTLDSIVWMNENHHYEGVTTMVVALAKFFRISISRGNEIIDVADEIEHARSYLIIQQTRYKNKFDFSIEAQPEVFAHKTLKLILQPIVENAIYHGIKNLQEKGEIKIKAGIEDDKILFQVIDNGYGIKPEHLNDLLTLESSSTHSSGVGLKNVNERIKLYFGSPYGIEIISELEVGTIVNIRIPLTEPKDGGTHEQNT